MSFEEKMKLRKEINKEIYWCQTLEDKGHAVMVFDGYDDGLHYKFLNSRLGAASLYQIVTDYPPKAVLYDLDYHGKITYGLEMLRLLKEWGCQAFEGKRLVIFSSYIGEEGLEPEVFYREFPTWIRAVEKRLDTAKAELIALITAMDKDEDVQ